MKNETKFTLALFAIVVACVLTMALSLLAPSCAHAQTPSITLDWTAPGDDSLSGTASSYEIRWRAGLADTTGMTAWLNSGGKDTNVPAGLASWWSGATRYTGAVPAPAVAGTLQSAVLAGPWAAGTYTFQLRACDDGLPGVGGSPTVPGPVNCTRSNVTVRVVTATAAQDVSGPAPVRDLRTRVSP